MFKYVIQTNILFYNILKIDKLFSLEISKKNKYFDVIIKNMDLEQLCNLINSMSYKDNDDEIIFEKIFMKINIVFVDNI